jgi:hypothetical protein
MARALIVAVTLISLFACVPAGSASEPATTDSDRPVGGQVATPEERAACEAAGGEIMVAGLFGDEVCIQAMPDAGQACSDSSQCVGRCLNTENFVDYGQPVTTGQCEPTNAGFGCAQEVIDGRGDYAICVD